jgi:hypothetical protein
MPLFTILTIPSTGTADLLAYTGELFTDTWQLVALAIGIPLAFYIISRVIGLFRSRGRRVA